MISDVTSLQVDLTQPITFKMLILLIISDACLLSSTRNYVPDEQFMVF